MRQSAEDISSRIKGREKAYADNILLVGIDCGRSRKLERNSFAFTFVVYGMDAVTIVCSCLVGL